MSNLLYFKGVIAAAGQPRKEAAMSPAFRTGDRPLSASRPARPPAPPLCRGGRRRHSAPLPAHRRLRRAAVSRPAQRCAHHKKLPRHRVRHAVARQVLAPRRLGEHGIPPHLARLCADDPRSLSSAGTGQAKSATGCSIGGRIVLHLAHEHPEKFRAIIGLESSPKVDPYYDTSWLHRPDVHGGEVSAGIVSGLVAPTAPNEGRWERSGITCRAGPACSRATCTST